MDVQQQEEEEEAEVAVGVMVVAAHAMVLIGADTWPDRSIGWLGPRLGALKDAKNVRLLPSDPDRQIGEEGGEGEARAVERRRLSRVLIAARCVNKVRQA